MARSDRSGARTRAARALDAQGVDYELLEYDLAGAAPEASLGEAAAAALGLDPASVFKTLVADADGELVCAVVPVDGTLSLKALARAAGAKRAAMADTKAAERATGYVVGGISPLGQTRALRTFIDASALLHAHVCVSAGQRGLQLRLAPGDLVSATDAAPTEGLGQR